jgi:uncharacterized phage protein (TIGR02220 family)
MPEEGIARLLGLDNQVFNQTLSTLLTYGVARRRESDGAIFNKRMVEDEALCEKRRKAGKMGGNPLLLNQNPTTGDKQKTTPSSSSSSSSSEDKAAAAEILAHLNEKAGHSYKPLPATIRLIAARLNEGATVDECKAVVDSKVAEWAEDTAMRKYLRPATLFGASNFANYVGQLGAGGPSEKEWE